MCVVDSMTVVNVVSIGVGPTEVWYVSFGVVPDSLGVVALVNPSLVDISVAYVVDGIIVGVTPRDDVASEEVVVG